MHVSTTPACSKTFFHRSLLFCLARIQTEQRTGRTATLKDRCIMHAIVNSKGLMASQQCRHHLVSFHMMYVQDQLCKVLMSGGLAVLKEVVLQTTETIVLPPQPLLLSPSHTAPLPHPVRPPTPSAPPPRPTSSPLFSFQPTLLTIVPSNFDFASTHIKPVGFKTSRFQNQPVSKPVGLKTSRFQNQSVSIPIGFGSNF